MMRKLQATSAGSPEFRRMLPDFVNKALAHIEAEEPVVIGVFAKLSLEELNEMGVLWRELRQIAPCKPVEVDTSRFPGRDLLPHVNSFLHNLVASQSNSEIPPVTSR